MGSEFQSQKKQKLGNADWKKPIEYKETKNKRAFLYIKQEQCGTLDGGQRLESQSELRIY